MNFLKNYSIHILLIIIIFFLYITKNQNNGNFTSERGASILTQYKTKQIVNDYATINYQNSDFIRNNSIEIESKHSEKSKNKIELETKANNGIINSINSFYVSNKIGYNILLKIPTEKADSFITNVIKNEGKVLSENFSIENVAKQYNNNTVTINSLTTRRNNLKELLKKSEKIDDILKIDRELTAVQNQLDNYLNINKNIKEDINLTSINITINPRIFLENEWNINASLYKAFKCLVIFSQKIIDLVIYLLLFSPYILILYIINKVLKK